MNSVAKTIFGLDVCGVRENILGIPKREDTCPNLGKKNISSTPKHELMGPARNARTSRFLGSEGAVHSLLWRIIFSEVCCSWGSVAP